MPRGTIVSVGTTAVRKKQRYIQRDFVVMGRRTNAKRDKQNTDKLCCHEIKKIRASPSPDKAVRKGFSTEGTLSPEGQSTCP